MIRLRNASAALRAMLICLGILLLNATFAASSLPSFDATSLTGEKVSSDALVGQRTLLILTPSRGAAESTRRWVRELRNAVDIGQYRVRDVLAIDLPFFMSEADAIDKAKQVIPKRYHDQTWILASPVLEKALDISRNSELASVIVLNQNGTIIDRVHGAFNKQRLDVILKALSSAP